MSEEGCLLYTAEDGSPDGAAFIVLHDRYAGLDDARRQGEWLGPDVCRIAVRSFRLQTVGGAGDPFGYYWFLGPPDEPELASLGDSLSQLEILLLDAAREHGGKVGLYGRGEGGMMALLLALIWPEKTARVILEDMIAPVNLARVPVEIRAITGLPVVLRSTGVCDMEPLAKMLKDLGADLTVTDLPEKPEITDSSRYGLRA